MNFGPIGAESFICTRCGMRVFFPKADYNKWKLQGWKCAHCWNVLYEKRYPVNIKGGLTVFTALGSKEMGKALGDSTVFEVIKRKYREDNPDEKVIFLEPEADQMKAIKKLNPCKIFLTEFFHEDTVEISRHPKTIRINCTNEVNKLATEAKMYPRLEYKPKRPDVDFPLHYVSLHIRNIEKSPERPNPSRNFPLPLANYLLDNVLQNYNIVIVGNDNVSDNYAERQNVVDLRNKLTLPELAFVLKNSFLFIGRDSGVAHVAAACGCQIVAFDYASEKWFPKTDPEKFDALLKKESTTEKIVECITKRL